MSIKRADTTNHFEGPSRDLEKLRIKILFEQSWAVQFSGLILAVLYIYLVRHKAPVAFLEVWALCLVLFTGARLLLIQRFIHRHVTLDKDFHPKKWENIFVAATACGGVIWAFAVCSASSAGDTSFDCLMGFILAGVTSGAAVAYNTSLKSAYAFYFPAVIPFAVKLALQGDETHLSMALMLFAYSVLYLKLTHQFNQHAIKSILLSFQKDQLIDRIRLMQSQVIQSAQMAALGQMAGGMAHEINNPLAIIMASSDLVQIVIDRNDTTRLRKDAVSLLTKITSASTRIAKIIKELGFFAGRPVDEVCIPISVSKIIENTMNFCNERFKAYSITVTIDPYSEDMTVECQSFHIVHAFLHLLNNSFDAICDLKERWLRIEVADLDDRIEIGITDSGLGIPEEIRSKIMQPFFTTKEVGKGMGLGLSIANGIVESHHGKLWLDVGSPNTRFVMSLPKKRAMASKEAA